MPCGHDVEELAVGALLLLGCRGKVGHDELHVHRQVALAVAALPVAHRALAGKKPPAGLHRLFAGGDRILAGLLFFGDLERFGGLGLRLSGGLLFLFLTAERQQQQPGSHDHDEDPSGSAHTVLLPPATHRYHAGCRAGKRAG